MGQLEAQNYEILYVDECLFNADGQTGRYWAPVNKPHQKVSKFMAYKRVVVCGAISAQQGLVHFKIGTRSFNANDMVKMLQQIKKRQKKKSKIAVYWDNARIHVSATVKAMAKKLKMEEEKMETMKYWRFLLELSLKMQLLESLFLTRAESQSVLGLEMKVTLLIT